MIVNLDLLKPFCFVQIKSTPNVKLQRFLIHVYKRFEFTLIIDIWIRNLFATCFLFVFFHYERFRSQKAFPYHAWNKHMKRQQFLQKMLCQHLMWPQNSFLGCECALLIDNYGLFGYDYNFLFLKFDQRRIERSSNIFFPSF